MIIVDTAPFLHNFMISSLYSGRNCDTHCGKINQKDQINRFSTFLLETKIKLLLQDSRFDSSKKVMFKKHEYFFLLINLNETPCTVL